MAFRFLGFFVMLVSVIIAAQAAVSAELTSERFTQLHRELQADDAALWRTIPWNTDLLVARRKAGQQNRPIFIWAMDGHPLGCT
ncbi:hypothetical protein [Planctomycetes bacterium K23_9]|uniref:Uncharacterized protein n=1 Tax=Stieleria marina TaxID=1930275 RepID=A0A517NRH0_9BACT|nr:hypothetical protein K239x_16560 [Planctomycetes bacterium K23_9]